MITAIITMLLTAGIFVFGILPFTALYNVEGEVPNWLKTLLGDNIEKTGFEYISFAEGQEAMQTCISIFYILTLVMAGILFILALCQLIANLSKKKINFGCRWVALVLFIFMAVLVGLVLGSTQEINNSTLMHEANYLYTASYGLIATGAAGILCLFFAPKCKAKSKKKK